MKISRQKSKIAFLALSVLFFSSALFFLSVPTKNANAQNCGRIEEGVGGDYLTLRRSIVPCARDCDEPATTTIDESGPCTLCHLLIMAKNIFDLMFAWLIIVALGFLTIAGVIFIVSLGNQARRALAKNIVEKTLGGFALFILSWLIVYTILVVLSVDEDMLGLTRGVDRWFEFSCSTTSSYGAYQGEGYELPPTPPGPPPPGPTAPPDDTPYTFQPGIQPQVGDASTALLEFMFCMNEQLPAAAKVVSSISDSAGMDRCVNDYSRPPCAHSEFSCHYGGRNCRGESYAVDFANEYYHSMIYAAAIACNGSAYVVNEGTHVHVSIGAASGCGCN